MAVRGKGNSPTSIAEASCSPLFLSRANTNNSATNSPVIASSPIASSFPVIKDIHRKSPPSSIVQRAQPSRSRQNSAQTLPPDARNGTSSSTLNKAPNKNGAHCEAVDGGKVPSTAGRSIAELKTAMKESLTLKSEHQAEEPLDIDGLREVRSAGAVSSGRIIERTLKREESENGTSRTRPDRPPSISISARGAGKSKPSGPQSATASEPPPPRSRTSRTVEPPPIKRSHKKGAGQAAQLEREAAAAAAARANHHDEEGSSMQGEEEEEEEELDGSEPRYCYCDGVSYGEMVACDMPDCKREWFHLGCVGLAKAPTKNGKSFCILDLFDCPPPPKKRLNRGEPGRFYLSSPLSYPKQLITLHFFDTAKWFCNECLKDKASKIPSPTTIVAAATATTTSPITAGGR